MPHIDYKHAIDTLPMFEDNTVNLIYCSHSFEYFDRQEVPSVLAEWRRILRKGGVLRLAVPDFAALSQLYQSTGDISYVLGPLYGRMVIKTTNGPLALYHKTVYDYASLSALLEANGFANVRRYDWRETVHKDHDDHSQAYFPHMDKENGLLVSLNVEADRI